MYLYTLKQIADYTGGKLYGKKEKAIEHLVFDTRRIGRGKAALFFALRTDTGDGHAYLSQLSSTEIEAVVVDHFIEGLGIDQLVVSNTLRALQDIVAQHRANFNIPVIAITGSNGKTIVKEWLYHLFKDKYRVLRSPKSYNSQIGVPLSLWPLNESYDLAIIEAGISKKGEMQYLQSVIQPTHGVFTHFGDAHGQNFSSPQEKLNEKLLLFKSCKRVYSPSIYKFKKLEWSPNTILQNWGNDINSDLEIIELRSIESRTQIDLKYKQDTISLDVPFQDTASIDNALTVALVGLDFGLDLEELSAKISSLPAVDMRLQQIDGINRNKLFLDHYNSDMESLEIALQHMKQQSNTDQRVIILSDLLETELEGDKLYTKVNQLMQESSIDELIGIGKDIGRNSSLFNLKTSFYNSTTEFLDTYPLYNLVDSFILIKGARKFELEKVANVLRKKSHQTVLEVNMSRLQHNLSIHKRIVGKSTKIMAMVKAFSYGSGGYQLAKALEYNKVDYLGVAYIDEGIELRRAGINLPIMVLNTDYTKLDQLVEFDLEPVVYTQSNIEVLKNLRTNSTLNAHIEIDTGMHRLGFTETDVLYATEQLKSINQVRLASVFSHLSSADDPEMDEYTQRQINIFNELSTKIEALLGYEIIKHISNTAGVQRHPKSKFNMVRLGIGLYGISAKQDIENELLTVGTFKSYITQIRTVKKGEGVGYGSLDRSESDREIAVVAVGYADGYDRRFSCGVGKMLIQGKLASVVGNVCMDMTMCDVTGIDCNEGDEVILFGDKPRVEDLASSIGTIPYELLTNVSQRVSRIYFQE